MKISWPATPSCRKPPRKSLRKLRKYGAKKKGKESLVPKGPGGIYKSFLLNHMPQKSPKGTQQNSEKGIKILLEVLFLGISPKRIPLTKRGRGLGRGPN